MKKHKSGFTLAEVLITLVIIGIIAAMTIPTLMNKTNEQETVVAVKKAYSVLNQAYQRMVAENGEIHPQYLGASAEEALTNFGDMFTKQLSLQENCGTSTDGDCVSSEYFLFDGSSNSDFNTDAGVYKFRLNDGSVVLIFNIYNSYLATTFPENSPLKYIFGKITVDVNGDKGANTFGKDVFRFWITKYGIIPAGTPEDRTFRFANCRTDGYGCTAWVVTKGNMDYLRKDVSW